MAKTKKLLKGLWSKNNVELLRILFPSINTERVGTAAKGRTRKLRELLNDKKLIRIIEAHNGLSGMIGENVKLVTRKRKKEFDGMWLGSLTDSIAKGRPDAECVSLISRIITLDEILRVTTKPIIYDGESGGKTGHFISMVQTLERLGVSAVIIEDKKGPKRSSLLENADGQRQDSIENVCTKITSGKRAQVTDDFMVIARIESLILNRGLKNALTRAKAYIAAGADGVMIHSNNQVPKEILEFCSRYSKLDNRVPLVAVPSTYSQVTEQELTDAGVRVVIYANQMLRSVYPAMVRAARSILESERAWEIEKESISIRCMSIREFLALIPHEF